MKVAELEGTLLDLWVARFENVGVYADAHGYLWHGNSTYRPSSDWSQGGPIIEHARIQIVPQQVNHLRWSAYIDEGFQPGALPIEQYGETPLQAAMRAYVAAKFGDEVPDMENAQPGSAG